MRTKLTNSSILMIFLLAVFLLPTSILAQQTQDRIIKYNSWRNEPVKITSVKVNSSLVEFGEIFQAEDDWLRGLTFSVINTSDREICHIDLALDFPRATSNEPMTRERLLWNCKTEAESSAKSSKKAKPLKPGESLEIVLSNEFYPKTQEYLRRTNNPTSINLLEVSVDEVSFVGDKNSLWISGQMMRRDPGNPNWLIPIREKQ
ncbi:MAG TPA: hypothetical protein VF556_16395 [Pyrinomonadaceae bacterium]|jgi:hypothetical protein